MRNPLIATAVASALAAASLAPSARAQEASELESLRSQLQQALERIDALEKQQQTQQEAHDRTTDAIAQARTSAKSSEWAAKLSWKGDARYRHENVDPEEAVTDQTRHRVRARFGLTAKVNDTIAGTVQLATNGGNNDPRSTNQTLGNDFDRKGVSIDLAYIDWKAVNGLNVMLGKMPQPWQRVGSYFWDPDITPEGGALKFTRGPFFATAFGMWLSERSTATDTTLSGAQLGVVSELGAAKLTGAVGYYDVGGALGEITSTATGCTANTVFFGGPQGNTTIANGTGCATLANDFNMVEALAQLEMKAGALPLVLFAHYIQNQEAETLDTGYAAGITLGKASDAGKWELSYVYQTTEKDAQFGQFVDSDFGGGLTDVQGSVVRVGIAPLKNFTVNGTYFLNDRFVDAGTEMDYKRYQLDLNYKF